jgi:hypothetical protein
MIELFSRLPCKVGWRSWSSESLSAGPPRRVGRRSWSLELVIEELVSWSTSHSWSVETWLADGLFLKRHEPISGTCSLSTRHQPSSLHVAPWSCMKAFVEDQILGCAQAYLLDVALEPSSNPCGLFGVHSVFMQFRSGPFLRWLSHTECEFRFSRLLLMTKISSARKPIC